MTEPRFRAAPPDHFAQVVLDAFVAVFHRPSGVTHLLTSPAPELLALLADGPLTSAELRERLTRTYDVADAESGALDERLAELVIAGLALKA